MKRALALCLLAVGLSIVGPALANDTVYYYYNDAQGSPVAVTDASGNVIERTQYAPYGQVLNRPEHDGPGYTGHEEDAATGLTNMQQRYDDKALGRMLSTDPMEVDTTSGSNFNRYAYANDNPYRYTDPTGMCTGTHICNGDGTAKSTGTFTTSPGAGDLAQARLATAQARLNQAVNYMQRHTNDVSGSYSSSDSAKAAFGKTFGAESGKLGVEFGANIITGLGHGGLSYSLTDFSTSTDFIGSGKYAGYAEGVAIAGRPGDPSHWGMVHTHWAKIGDHGNFFSRSDWRIMIERRVNGFVIFPDQTSESFDYSKYNPRTMTPDGTYNEQAKFSF